MKNNNWTEKAFMDWCYSLKPNKKHFLKNILRKLYELL
jgi:hypothetical protein